MEPLLKLFWSWARVVLELYWHCAGIVLGLLYWSCTRLALELFSNCPGAVLEPHWNSAGTLLEQYGSCSGVFVSGIVVLGLWCKCCNGTGSILDLHWDCTGTILALYWKRAGIVYMDCAAARVATRKVGDACRGGDLGCAGESTPHCRASGLRGGPHGPCMGGA